MPICRKCGKPFDKKRFASNAKDCDDCSIWSRYGHGVAAALWRVYPQMKAAADASGNPKIWTAKEHSQEFLKSLIPVH